MEINKYRDFLATRSDEEKEDLKKLTLSALEKNDTRVLLTSKFIIVCLLTYFLFRFNLIDKMQIFGLSIGSSELLFSVMPTILSVSYFLYINIQFRKQELKFLLDTQLKDKYNVETAKPLDLHWITQLLTPLEFNQTIYSFKGKLAFINIPMYIVSFCIYLIPFWILKDGISILMEFNSKTVYDYFLIIAPIVITSHTFLLFVYYILTGIKDQITVDQD
ncbi:hypothetical protein [Sphingobacterium luzhongxinii]|uniref:hypothetical protein n=1 Tax=Sphingobacterium luzhongxinii TaxID=2654181 RepID=UPI0013DC61CA|nr:hypothetical protein [Sphingobacterium sp. xlx-73]